MRPDCEPIRRAILQALPRHTALCVAFSGGRDSTVLLHSLAGLRPEMGFVLRAAHVNHGLQSAAEEWETHCAVVARRLDVPYSAHRVTVRTDPGGRGLEAAAREARYDALRTNLKPGEWLLTAHHASDQLETVVLHLLRGSGVHGLAGIPRDTAFGPGRLVRPLLDVPVEVVEAFASAVLLPQGIHWLVDPTNADPAFDRSFLRGRVLPVLQQRFPAAARAAGRSATLAAEAAALLDELGANDGRVIVAGDRVSLPLLRDLRPARQRNLIRWLARQRGWASPPERRLRAGLDQLLGAAPGRAPVLGWAGHEIRRFRDHLYLLDSATPGSDLAESWIEWADLKPLRLGGLRGELSGLTGTGVGLASKVVASGLQVAFRSGGERVRSGTDRHHRTLKYLFQSHGILPWMRSHVPLVFAKAELAAVADLWIADWAAAQPEEAGLQIVWSGHPPIQ